MLPRAAKHKKDSHLWHLYHSYKYLQTFYQSALSQEAMAVGHSDFPSQETATGS